MRTSFLFMTRKISPALKYTFTILVQLLVFRNLQFLIWSLKSSLQIQVRCICVNVYFYFYLHFLHFFICVRVKAQLVLTPINSILNIRPH